MTHDLMEAALQPFFDEAATAAKKAIESGLSGRWSVLGGDLPGSSVSISMVYATEGVSAHWKRAFQYSVPIFVNVHGTVVNHSRTPWVTSLDLESEADVLKAVELVDHFRTAGPFHLARAVRDTLASLSRHVSPSVLVSEVWAAAVQSVLEE